MESTKRSEQEEERQYLIVDRMEVNTEEEEEADGGWGWIVVLACFLTTFTLDGKPIFIFYQQYSTCTLNGTII